MIRFNTSMTRQLCALVCLAAMTLMGCEQDDGTTSDTETENSASADAGSPEADGMQVEDPPTNNPDEELPTDETPPPMDEDDPEPDPEPQDPPPSDGRLDLNVDCEPQIVAHPIESIFGELDSGATYLYAVPPDAQRLIFLFHGGGGSKEDNLEGRVEAVLIAQRAYDQGYAIVSLDSMKHTTRGARDVKWNESEPDVNPDVANVAELIQMFRQDLGLVPPNAPVVAMGFSNGGSMASRSAQLEEISAAVIYISNAQYFSEPGARIPPTIFSPGANDPGHALRSNTTYMESIEANGGIAELLVNPAEPATRGVFTKIPGVDCETSTAMIRGLIESGWLDEEGHVLQDPNSSMGWSDNLPASFASVEERKQVRDILVELYAGHSPSADWNDEVFSFLDEHLAR